MTTTAYEVIGALIITGAAILGKFVEHSHLFHKARTNSTKSHINLISVYYECANYHLHLSLGMLGLAWSQRWDAAYCGPIFLLILLGAVLKGIIADSKVVTLRFTDSTAFCGLYLPNILALLCVGWALVGRDIMTNKSGTENGQNSPAKNDGMLVVTNQPNGISK